MKNFIMTALVMLCICTGIRAQYIVTKVTGRVKNEAGNYIKPGTELKSDEKISWSSLNDKLWVIIVGKGEKIITPSPNATPGNNLFTEVLLASVHQNSKSGTLSGRGEILEKIPDALHTDAKSNGKVIIEQVNKFIFDPAAYPQTNGAVFFIEIDIPQAEPVIRKLKTVGDTLIINYADLLTETSNPSIKYALGYHNSSAANKNRLVVSFSPYFDLTNEMDGIIANGVVAYLRGNRPQDAARDSIYLNIYANSGKPNGILFTSLFNKYWQSRGNAEPLKLDNMGLGGVFDEAAFTNVPRLSSSVSITRSELPANFSLREYAPPVGNQGQYGSCTAWATAYATRTISYAIQHNYSVNNQYDKIIGYTFSPDFIYNNTKTSSDCLRGVAIPSALTFMTNKGNIVRPNDSFVCGRTYESSDLVDARAYRIKDFMRVNAYSSSKEDLIAKMKSLIVSKHALPFGMHIPTSFFTVDMSGVWNPAPQDYVSVARVRKRLEPYNGHAMCVIGYNDAINNGSFEVMNSWGVYGRGNNGFYWINYDDFYAFAMDIYAINDFDVPPESVLTAVKEEPDVTIKPLLTNKEEVTQKILRSEVSRPKLKGSMEFRLLKSDNTFETIPVTKQTVGSRGQVVEADKADASTFANFLLSKPFYSGNQYKIKFNLVQAAYVYVIGMDKQSNYNLFPLKKYNESALINVNNATLYLPSDSTSFTLDNVTGKEKMCLLISRSPIDVDAINQLYADGGDHNLYQAVRTYLAKRLLEMKAVNYNSAKIDFDTEVNDDQVLAFFVEINHL